ncbi:TFIIA-alpha and beta-like factor isoform X2 [Fukomys damarensis]|uniref:TFIIA-alpha and beta-like factor n=1 Tax=Fukomys damarensis TaxID=885580 RepID=A0A091CN07_FUKDA|nr:TFIIA-alpha and beta-like factor isoform X2 [Fukomys damarensis]KFO18460.1 TFIIA-alpha and beta-like factor [Fukomys damarensis]
MAGINPVPKLYRSIIEDVIEGVRDLFAEEGIEEHVLKDLKQLWETKVLQSKATEDFLRNNIHSPLFTLQLPHTLHQTLPSTASLVIPAGRTLPGFTTAELGTSNSSANFAFPGYPVHVPAGVTLQTASGHLYKVNVPIMVTQTSERPSILQHPIQVFQHVGQPSVIQASVPQLNPCSLQATSERPQRMEAMLQQPTILHSGPVDRKHLENATSDTFVLPGNEHGILSEALLSQQESPQCVCVSGVVFPSQDSPIRSSVGPVLGVPARVTQNLLDGSLSEGSPRILHHQVTDTQPHLLKYCMYGGDSINQPREIEEPRRLPVSKKNSNSQVDLSSLLTDDDINEIIQVDGTGDTSSNEEIKNIRDVEENEFLEIIDAGNLKVLEEEAESISNDSVANSSDNENTQLDIVEEDPLNSEDDVSEQDVPDLFDTDNVIVCQYDKIHRNKNKWKFYLKDGIMCFEGRDYVFAKAIGDAEW